MKAFYFKGVHGWVVSDPKPSLYGRLSWNFCQYLKKSWDHRWWLLMQYLSWLACRFFGEVSLIYFLVFWFFDYCFREVVTEADIPAELSEEVSEKRRELIECVSEADDELAEMFLSDEPISGDVLMVSLSSHITLVCHSFGNSFMWRVLYSTSLWRTFYSASGPIHSSGTIPLSIFLLDRARFGGRQYPWSLSLSTWVVHSRTRYELETALLCNWLDSPDLS